MRWFIRSRNPRLSAFLVALFAVLTFFFASAAVRVPSLTGPRVSVPVAALVPLVIVAAIHQQLMLAPPIDATSVRSPWLLRRALPLVVIVASALTIAAAWWIKGSDDADAVLLAGQNLALYVGITLIADTAVRTQHLAWPAIAIVVVSCFVLAVPTGVPPRSWAITLRTPTLHSALICAAVLLAGTALASTRSQAGLH